MFTGDMRPIDLTDKLTAEFWHNTFKGTICWSWSGNKDEKRYGFMSNGLRAHRYSYTLHFGPIPEGLTIDHLCRRTHCVRPDHLEAVPSGENVLRGNGPCAVNARKTHCVRGHDITQPGSYRVRPSRPRERRCVECERTRIR